MGLKRTHRGLWSWTTASSVATSSAEVWNEAMHCWLSATRVWVYQATNRLPLASLEEYEDSGTTQKEDVKKTPAKVLPSTRSKHCMIVYYMHVNDYNKQIWNVKVDNKTWNWISVASVLSLWSTWCMVKTLAGIVPSIPLELGFCSLQISHTSCCPFLSGFLQ